MRQRAPNHTNDTRFLLELPGVLREEALKAARAQGIPLSEWVRRAMWEKLGKVPLEFNSAPKR